MYDPVAVTPVDASVLIGAVADALSEREIDKPGGGSYSREEIATWLEEQAADPWDSWVGPMLDEVQAAFLDAKRKGV